MELSSLHILLTYQCTFECDHCFVFGSPWQSGTLTLPAIRRILEQATSLNSVEWIYFEGGEPLGNIHLCQGVSLGNLFTTSLAQIWANFHPQEQPVVAALLRGGPAELARSFAVPTQPEYADACHLCFETRRQLRPRFPEFLLPDQMYGVP